MKILFVSGYELNSTNANASCLKTVIEKMNNYEGNDIDVLDKSIFDETNIKSWKNNPLTFIKRILYWPAIDPDAVKKCKKLLQNYNLSTYDYVVVPHKPYEAVLAVINLKKRFSNAKIYLYELDPMTNEIDKKNGIGKHLFFLSILKEKRMYDKVDRIFHMECNRKKYTSSSYKLYFEKFRYLDFPLISYDTSVIKVSENPDVKRFVYSGALDKVYRNPAYMLMLLDKLDNFDINTKFAFCFFTKGNCESNIEKYCNKNKSFIQHGYVEQNTLQTYLKNSDFLINIGNHYSDMIPSKLFTYISKGKPIIHFSSKKDDPCIPYLEQYGLALIIQESEPLEKNLIRLFDFVHQNIGKSVNFNDILKKFDKNTAEWSAKQIISQMRKDYANGDKK